MSFFVIALDVDLTGTERGLCAEFLHQRTPPAFCLLLDEDVVLTFALYLQTASLVGLILDPRLQEGKDVFGYMVGLCFLHLAAHIIIGIVAEVVEPIILNILSDFEEVVGMEVGPLTGKGIDECLYLVVALAFLFAFDAEGTRDNNKLDMGRIALFASILIERFVGEIRRVLGTPPRYVLCT